MFAGLPGTGVGGIFYLLLTLWMPFHELIEMGKGRPTSRERWAFIARHWVLFAGVIVMMFAQAWIMKLVIPAAEREVVSRTTTQTVNTIVDTKAAGMMGATAAMALLSLAGVVAIVHTLRAGRMIRRLAGI